MEWWENADIREGVPFALDAEGEWRDVDEVPRGKACGCFCADCKGPLVARHGDVRVHHFAHDDRRDCRHALETSLFGMAMSLMAEEDAVVSLPPCGDRYELARRAGVPLFLIPYRNGDWVVPAVRLGLAGAELRARTIDASIPERAEIFLPKQKIEIHLLSFRKTFQQLEVIRHDPMFAVLGINLRDYAQMWWQVCDAQKEQRIKAAAEARGLMRRWLSEHLSGRGWFFHPEVEQEKARLQALIEIENARRAKDVRPTHKQEYAIDGELDPRWVVPASENHPDPQGGGVIATGSGLKPRPPEFMKPVGRDVLSPINQDRALELGLRWHKSREQWFFVGASGELVPERVRRVLSRETEWEPVMAGDRSDLCRVRDNVSPLSVVLPAPARPPPAKALTPPAPAPAPRPDEILKLGVGACTMCGAPLNEVRFANGYYEGRRGIRCSANARHPTRILQ